MKEIDISNIRVKHWEPKEFKKELDKFNEVKVAKLSEEHWEYLKEMDTEREQMMETIQEILEELEKLKQIQVEYWKEFRKVLMDRIRKSEMEKLLNASGGHFYVRDNRDVVLTLKRMQEESREKDEDENQVYIR